MDIREKQLNEFKERFKKEIEGITNIDDLKELFSKEIARRDLLIEELRNQNKILMKTAFNHKVEELKLKRREEDK